MNRLPLRLRLRGTTTASLVAYIVLLATALAEKWGQTTNDTKLSVVDTPGALLRSSLSLWNPQVSLGELQNQAYGYLFPMGPFFAGLESAHVPPWVSERIWSVTVLVVACEGARLVCRTLGLSPWPAWIAGLAYGLSTRMLSEIGVRSAEVLPTAVLPWMLVPILLALGGRLGHRRGALFSAAAFLFAGAVNGTATVAPLSLVAVFIIWGVRGGLAPRSLLLWWSGLIGLVSIWWASSLLQLSAFSPPFFDYVEDARTTTRTAGYVAAIRGASNWVGYLSTGDKPSWPAAWSLTFSPVLVLATGLLAATSLVGLASFRSVWRTPLALGALLGLVCLTVGHTSSSLVQSPLAPHVQRLLDDPFALLRNVAKIDPVLRLPMSVGLAAALERMAAARRAAARLGMRRRIATATLAVLCALVSVSAEPALAMNLRTPGWSTIPGYWSQTAAFLHAQPGQNRAWVIPGSGFGVETWGWTMDEPMSAVARSPWVSRSQVPLAPAETIRLLSSLEEPLESGAGSPGLGAMLARIGLGYVVVRHDLDPSLSESTAASLVSIAMARSGGVRAVATFGRVGLTPAIEIFRVTDTPADDFSLTGEDAVLTVSSGPADVLSATAAGALPVGHAAVVDGDSGWNHPVDIVGDGYQLRERQFGRVRDAEGAVLATDEPRHADRVIENYPGAPGARPVTARYDGIQYVDASTSQGYPTTFGPIRPDEAPFAAVDGNPKTSWTTGYLTDPVGQWLEVHFSSIHDLGTVRISSRPGDVGVRRWRVTAGGYSVAATVDPFTGIAIAHLEGFSSDTLRVTAQAVSGGNRPGQISIAEISAPELPARRTLVVPGTSDAPRVDYLFHSQPEVRACVPTLLGPDCDPQRYRPAEESTGIDRTITVARPGTWTLDGTVLARAEPATARLLEPRHSTTVVQSSSTYFDDPGVTARMAYDGDPRTSWIADPADRSPALTVDFKKPQTVETISIGVPAAPAVTPTSATLVAHGQARTVQLAGDGYAAFKPLRARHFELRLNDPVRGGAPLGASEVRLGPGRSEIKLDGSAGTGAYCGFGPNVYVDGTRHLTRVAGLLGDVVSAGPLGLTLCGGPLQLSRGTHRIWIGSTDQFQPVRVLLAQRATTPRRAIPRSLHVYDDRDDREQLSVGPGEASVLATVRNFNTGWRATLSGQTLPSQRVDGWAQGWRVPAGQGGTIRITYAPQRSYRWGLVGGLIMAGLVLLAALALLVRSPLRPATSHVLDTRGPDRRPSPVTTATVAMIAGLLGGLPALVGASIGCGLVGRRLGHVLGGGLLVLGSGWTAIMLLLQGPQLVPSSADVLAGTGAALLLTLALIRGPERGA